MPLSSITRILTHSVPAREAIRVNKQFHVCEKKLWHVQPFDWPYFMSVCVLLSLRFMPGTLECCKPLACNGTINEGSEMPCKNKYHHPKFKFENKGRGSHTFTSMFHKQIFAHCEPPALNTQNHHISSTMVGSCWMAFSFPLISVGDIFAWSWVFKHWIPEAPSSKPWIPSPPRTKVRRVLQPKGKNCRC